MSKHGDVAEGPGWEDRFMSKVVPEPNSGCWLWDGFVDRDGYGVFATDHRSSMRVHREGRRAIGAELDPETFDKAVKRLRRGYTPTFSFGDATA